MADRVPTPLLVLGLVMALWTVATAIGVTDGPSGGFNDPMRLLKGFF
ncbi:hypothetical protein [Ovoidimarina sediminis]|nr:hypothetical protein [Rhodophyticola sp. MJ-SS7]MDU8943210.1 hypothetical protein [Rhodophyticola sp. MJ-SS7]